MTKKELIADLAFPDNILDINELESKYKSRDLDADQWVTRMAPSPTGFVHIGAIYMGLLNYLLAKQTKGISILRIEDTDQKRQIEDGIEVITSAFSGFGLNFDEGMGDDGKEHGNYGPYIQSERRNIYRSYAKDLLIQNKAYVCFCSAEDLNNIREEQIKKKIRTGYYGEYACCRSLSEDDVLDKLEKGNPFVIRMRSNGYHEKRTEVKDIVRGKRSLPQNDIDQVIIKSNDGLPTYHFAHVIDDHLMRTTHVIRGDEWLSSLPLHIEMFYNMGWKAPKYGHLSPIQKMDGEAKRKLSKRKDPEANIEYFIEQGYPVDAIIEYLLNLANSNFEDWRKQNLSADVTDFTLDLKKTSPSGALFDIDKLNSLSKGVISEYTNIQAYDLAIEWAKKYSSDFYDLMVANEAYVKAILNIEKETSRKRKDIAKWDTLEEDVSFFFDELFTAPNLTDLEFDKEVILNCISEYLNHIDQEDDRDQWWKKIVDISKKNGFATDMKYYKKNKDEFTGSISDFMTIIRFALTGRENSPDLYEIMHVMGFDKVHERLSGYK